jgi:hypothetical protein
LIRRTEIKTYDGLAAFWSSSHSSTSLHGGDAVGSCTVVAETEVEAIVLVELVDDDGEEEDDGDDEGVGQGAWPRLGPQSGPPAAVVGVVGFPV